MIKKMNKLFVLLFVPIIACAGTKAVANLPANTSVAKEEVSIVEPVQELNSPKENKIVVSSQDEKPRPIECQKPWGATPEDSLEARRNFAILQADMDINEYATAYLLWQKLLSQVPCARTSLYTDAETILTQLAAKPENAAKKEILFDSLFISLEMRAKYFPDDEGYATGRLAYYLSLYRPKEFQKIISYGEKSMDLKKELTEYIVPSSYMNAVLIGLKNNKLNKEQVFQAYERVAPILEHNSTNPGDYMEYWKQIQQTIEESMRPILKCSDIDTIFLPKLKASPDDMELKNRVVRFYRTAKCLDNPNYIVTLNDLFAKKADPSTAEELAKYYEQNNNIRQANEYYEKAAELNTDPKRQVYFYLKAAQLSLKGNSYSQAQSFGNKVLGLDNNNGNALLILAVSKYYIAQSACDDAFDKRAAAWVAIDMFQRAANADPSVASEAQSKIASFKKYCPDKETAFFKGITAGQSYNVSCIGATTTVRFFE